jgi:hypothetical protein
VDKQRETGALLIAASIIAAIRLQGEPIRLPPKLHATVTDSIALCSFGVAPSARKGELMATTSAVMESIRARHLFELMNKVGFAVWQIQELEATLATYLVLRVKATRGIGAVRGNELMKKAEALTLGALIRELSKAGVLEDKLANELNDVLKERNWLVHRARREKRGVLADPDALDHLTAQLDSLSDRALQLHKRLAKSLEGYVVQSGVDPTAIDREADKLARLWSLCD